MAPNPIRINAPDIHRPTSRLSVNGNSVRAVVVGAGSVVVGVEDVTVVEGFVLTVVVGWIEVTVVDDTSAVLVVDPSVVVVVVVSSVVVVVVVSQSLYGPVAGQYWLSLLAISSAL